MVMNKQEKSINISELKKVFSEKLALLKKDFYTKITILRQKNDANEINKIREDINNS